MATGDRETRRANLLRGMIQVSIAMLAFTVINVVFTVRAVDNSSKANQARIQSICPVLQIFDSAYTAQPPTTDTGRNLQRALKEAILSYGCPNP